VCQGVRGMCVCGRGSKLNPAVLHSPAGCWAGRGRPPCRRWAAAGCSGHPHRCQTRPRSSSRSGRTHPHSLPVVVIVGARTWAQHTDISRAGQARTPHKHQTHTPAAVPQGLRAAPHAPFGWAAAASRDAVALMSSSAASSRRRAEEHQLLLCAPRAMAGCSL
jgi:hypothetical protein